MKKIHLLAFNLIALSSASHLTAMENSDDGNDIILGLAQPAVNPNLAELKSLVMHGDSKAFNAHRASLEQLSYGELGALFRLASLRRQTLDYAVQIGFGSMAWRIFPEIVAEVNAQAEEKRAAAENKRKMAQEALEAQAKAADPQAQSLIVLGRNPGIPFFAAACVAQEQKKLQEIPSLNEQQQARLTVLPLVSQLLLRGEYLDLLEIKVEVEAAVQQKIDEMQDKTSGEPIEKIYQQLGADYIWQQLIGVGFIKKELEEEYNTFEEVWGYDGRSFRIMKKKSSSTEKK